MAVLLPSIDSDEEFTAPSNANDDDENDGGDKMDTSFQFGGILVCFAAAAHFFFCFCQQFKSLWYLFFGF